MHYPPHPPRESDPHYADFEHYRRTHIKAATCAFAARRGGDTSECAGGLELHHSHIEFSLQQGVDIRLLERDYPGISDPAQVGAWVESDRNLIFYCGRHHRGHGGVHHADAATFEASVYVRNLVAE